MQFEFYLKHDFGCLHVNHCPHLGGAALGWLVLAANEQTEWTDSLLRRIDALQAEDTAKSHKIMELAAGVEQLKRELKAERQKQFKRKKEETAESIKGSKHKGVGSLCFGLTRNYHDTSVYSITKSKSIKGSGVFVSV